jgi:hypothetical protein
MELESSHKKAFGYEMALALFCKSYIIHKTLFLLIEKQETGPYFPSVEPVNGAPFYRKSSFEIDDKKKWILGESNPALSTRFSIITQ